MATLIANADGNLTGTTTFAATETGTSAQALIRANTTALASGGTITSPTFTVTNTDVIDGILLWLFVSSGTNGTGTLKVDLQKGGVSQKSVTVNMSDLPDLNNAVPAATFFKFGSTFTGDGLTTYTIVLTSTAGTGTAVVTYNRNSATAGDMTRAIRRTTAATPAAGDNLIIVGELTGAGTKNVRAVTMDSTATTAYGNATLNSTTVYGGLLAVGMWGTLSYGTSASTNYVLRLGGDLIVYQNGTLNIGSSGAEIPRNSTAALEFVPVSVSGDFGLRNQNGTVNIAGLSRTSGKNVVQCKLAGDVTGSSVLTSGPTALNVTNATSGGLDAGGSSLLASTAIDTVTSANHTLAFSGPSITNTTQTFQAWMARGTGTNNRFVRLEVGNNTVLASVTKGFFADVDLQAGTIGTCTAVGTGTATSASITAVGGGFLCSITGKVDGSAATPTGFIAICSAAGTTSFAGANNQALLYEGVQLVTTSSIGDTTFNVSADTGWLSGDQIVVASTTRTPTDCENFVLSANAGASSCVSHLYPFGHGGPTVTTAGTHSGTTPTQGEVGLLTRNVKIRSTSSTLMAYVYTTALSSFTASWAEFYYIGASTSNKRGIEIDGGATATAKSITFCSAHDCAVSGILFAPSAVTSLNVTFSNNIMWNSGGGTAFVLLNSTIVNTDWTIDSNLVMRTTGVAYDLFDIGGTFTNNTAVGSLTSAIGLAEIGTIGTFSGNASHSNANHGVFSNPTILAGVIDGLLSWRNGGSGLSLTNTSTADLLVNNPTIFGNATSNISYLSDVIAISGGTLSGDTTFSTPVGISAAMTGLSRYDVAGVDFSGTTSIFAPHTTGDISFAGSSGNTPSGNLNNCKFGTIWTAKTLWTKGAYLSFEKYNQVAGDHRTEMTYGQLKTDTTIFDAASPSMRMTPNSASSKLESAPKGRGILVPVLSGVPASISVPVRKSAAGDGAAYTGSQPRLVQRANPALGQNSDVVLATYASSTGSWNLISASTSSPTDDGAFELIVDCDGTAGWVNVDDWAMAA